MSEEAAGTETTGGDEGGPIDPSQLGNAVLGDEGGEEDSPFSGGSDDSEAEGEVGAWLDAEPDPDAEPEEAEGGEEAEAEASEEEPAAEAEAEGEGEQELEQGQEQQEAQTEDSLHTVKIDGEDKQVPLSELKDGYERSKASYKRFEEAAKLRKQTEAQFSRIKDNPGMLFKLAQHFGHDPQQLAEDYLVNEVITPNQLPKEARERLEAERRKREQMEERERQRKAQEQTEAKKRSQQEFREKTLPEIQSSMKNSGVPVNDASMRHVLHEMDKALQNGVELSPKEAVEQVAEHWDGAVKERLKNMEAKELLDQLGPEKAKSIREHFASEVQKPKSKAKPQATGSKSNRRKQGPLSLKEMEAQVKKNVGLR